MRWLLTSWGSFGDLHPFLALGRGLVARGHGVTLVGHPEWAAQTREAGLSFVPTGEPSRENFFRQNPEVLSMKWGGLVSLRTLVHAAIAPSLEPTFAALIHEAPAHDAIIAHHFTFAAPAVAALTDTPFATVSLAPGVIPSAYALPGANFGRARTNLAGRAWNRFIWAGGRVITARMVDPVVNAFRDRHGLPAVHGTIFDAHSERLNLQLYSERFAARAPDWSEEKRYAGFCFYDPPGEETLAPEIEEFLAKGEPPVLVTLGSTAVHDPGPFFRHAAEAIRAVGERGLLLIGPEANRPPHLPDSILAVGYVPFGRIMPRARAVMHQCGIGTLSHTLRAGVPSVACPFAFDQPNNARRLEALGLAEVVLPHQHDVPHLTAALRRVLAGGATVAARKMGEAIRAENGVERACEILGQTFSAKVVGAGHLP